MLFIWGGNAVYVFVNQLNARAFGGVYLIGKEVLKHTKIIATISWLPEAPCRGLRNSVFGLQVMVITTADVYVLKRLLSEHVKCQRLLNMFQMGITVEKILT